MNRPSKSMRTDKYYYEDEAKTLLVCFTYKWIVHTCGSLTLYFILSHLYQTNNDCGRKALTMWILKVENWFINLKTSHLEMCGGS